MSDLSSYGPARNESGGDALRYYTRRLRRHPVIRAWRQSSQRVKKFVPSLWRRATQDLRQLPSAVIIGAQKAGTTQVFAYLIKHPRLLPACSKEIDYFSRYADRSLEWYRSRFPLRRQVAALKGHALEASPSYICTPSALHKMHAVLPNAKIIAVLRDPVSRAFSHYQHAKTRRLEPRSFELAVEEELQQNTLRAEFGQALRPDVPALRGYVARGYYALQLELLLQLYPTERVLILDSADLFADTNTTCQRVFEFLEVESFDVQPGKVYNRGYYKETIDPLVAQRLRQHYRPHDELLQKLVGHPLGWMSKGQQLAA
jgi:hypothetical protein